MPTVTVKGSLTLQDAAKTLEEQRGSRYDITVHGSGAQQALKVKQSAAMLATVHLDHDGDATVFHIHGLGLLISRMVNEFGIAKRVAAAIEDTYDRANRDQDDGRR